MSKYCVVALCVFIFGCAPAAAQQFDLPTPPRIEPPETFPDHPRLFVDQSDIDALKDWAQRDPVVGDCVAKLVTQCEAEMKNKDLPGATKGDFHHAFARRAQVLAFGYVMTDRVEFAEAAARILVAYIEQVPTYEPSGTKGLVTSSALGETGWIVPLSSAYDQIYNAGVLTDEQKLAIEQDVIRASANVLRTCNHAGRSNWRMVSVAGFGTAGFAIGDRDLIDEALNGVHHDTGRLKRDGFAHHVGWSMLGDGVFYERSLTYQQYVLSQQIYLLEAARHSGLDLWHMELPGSQWSAGADMDRKFGQTAPRTIKALFEAPLYQSFGDRSRVQIGNAGGVEMVHRPHFEAAYKAYRDPKFAWLCHQTHDGRVPGNPLELIWMAPDMLEGRFDLSEDATIGATGRHVNACTLLPNGGITFLRQSAGRDAAAVMMTYGIWGSSHCHADQLSIAVYAAGHQIIPEPKYYSSYGDAKFIGWSRQTIGHNTVTVDEVSQNPQKDIESAWVDPAPGTTPYSQPVLFHAGTRLKAFRAICEPGRSYAGVTLDRTITLVDSLIVDFYRCRSDQQHQYDFSLHVDGTLTDEAVGLSDSEPGPLGEGLGYRYITDLRRAELNGVGELVYNRDDGTEPQLHMSFVPLGEAELIVGKGIVGKHGRQSDVVIVRKQATDVDFVTVLNPVSTPGGQITVEPLTDLPEGVLGVRIIRPGGSKTLVLSAESAGTFTYAGSEITGQVAVLREADDGTTELIEQAK